MQGIHSTCGLSLIYAVDLRQDKSLVFIRAVLSLVTALLRVSIGHSELACLWSSRALLSS